MKKSKQSLLTAALMLATAFTLSCSGDDNNSTLSSSSNSSAKESCIAAELAVKANTLDDVAAACNASRSEVLSQLPSNIGSCSKTDLDFDKPLRDVMEACGVTKIPTVSSSCNGSSSSSLSSNGNSSSSGSSSSSGNTADSCPPQYGIQEVLKNCPPDLYPYCYSKAGYKDCNLIGGKWIDSPRNCISGGGGFVNADYCNKNGIAIDNTILSYRSSSSAGSSSSISSSSFASNCIGYNGGDFCDPRDGNRYAYSIIGTQTWMTENLRYNASGSLCHDGYECTAYGRLYDGNAAHNVCPDGWHLPSNAEWKTLVNYVESEGDCADCAGTELKSRGWWRLGGYATPSGPVGYIYGYFDRAGFWWTSTESYTQYAWAIEDGYESAFAYCLSSPKPFLYSVRCVKD